MTETIALSSPVTEATLTALRTLGRPVGDGVKPSSPEKPPASFYPYLVLHTSTPDVRGSLVYPHEDALHRLHVACVGRTRESAEALRDEARALLLDSSTLDIDGYAVVWTRHAGSPEVSRNDQATPALYDAVVVVNVFVTPTDSGS